MPSSPQAMALPWLHFIWALINVFSAKLTRVLHFD
jgi:hypothetical protein